MRDFNSFKPNNDKDNQNSNMDLLKNLAKKYEGASEEDIVSAIMLEAEKGRKRGTLTDSDIDNFYKMLYPMLNSSQQKKLNSVILKIKKNK
jgi:hypothetical protein